MKKLLSWIVSALAICQSAYAAVTPDDLMGLGMPGPLAEVVASIGTGSAVLNNDTYFKARNAANSADLNVFKVDSSNNTIINVPAAPGNMQLLFAGLNGYSFEQEEFNYPDSGENGFHIEAPNQTTGIAICGGNGSENNRGACLDAFGASQATTPGMAFIRGADIAGGTSSNTTGHVRLRVFQDSEVQLQTSNGAQGLYVTPAGQVRYTASPLNFFADTIDGADNKYIALVGGGTSSSSRGASGVFEGNEVASTGGSAHLTSGDISTGNINFNCTNVSAETRFLKAGVNKLELVGAENLFNFLGTMGNSTKSPESDAEDDWIEVKINGTQFFIPVYAAS